MEKCIDCFLLEVSCCVYYHFVDIHHYFFRGSIGDSVAVADVEGVAEVLLELGLVSCA